MSVIKTIRRRKDWPLWSRWYEEGPKNHAMLHSIEPAWSSRKQFRGMSPCYVVLDWAHYHMRIKPIKRIKPGKSSLRRIV